MPMKESKRIGGMGSSLAREIEAGDVRQAQAHVSIYWKAAWNKLNSIGCRKRLGWACAATARQLADALARPAPST